MRQMTAKRFSAWLMAIAMAFTLFPAPAFAEGDGDGGSASEVATWSALYDALSAGGSIALTANVTWSDGVEALTVPEGVTVTLDLAGHTIDRGLGAEDAEGAEDGYVIFVASGASLTITDSSDGETGKITGGYRVSGTGYGGGGIFNCGTLALEAGSVSGNKAQYGGGVCNASGATFTMSGGSISGNSATSPYGDSHGGGVYNSYDATFTLSNGVISDNEAVSGGGVYGSITMTGGEISGNTATGDGWNDGGGGLHSYANATMTGGIISGNTSPKGGGVLNEGIFNVWRQYSR